MKGAFSIKNNFGFAFFIVCISIAFYQCKTDPVEEEINKEISLIENHIRSSSEIFKQYNFNINDPKLKYKILAGKFLFFNTNLSVNNTKSCASCHSPEFYFTDGYRRSTGALGDEVNRNSISLLNVITRNRFNWANSNLEKLTQQFDKPLFNFHPIELGMKQQNQVPQKIRENKYIIKTLNKAGINSNELTWSILKECLAAFCNTLVSFPKNEPKNLDEIAGKTIFNSEKANCSNCHGGTTFDKPKTSSIYTSFHKKNAKDSGLFLVTKKQEDLFKFRIPSLINIAKTGPYLHDGSVNDLSYFFSEINLNNMEKKQLIKYLISLTDSSVLGNLYFQKPRIGLN